MPHLFLHCDYFSMVWNKYAHLVNLSVNAFNKEDTWETTWVGGGKIHYTSFL